MTTGHRQIHKERPELLAIVGGRLCCSAQYGPYEDKIAKVIRMEHIPGEEGETQIVKEGGIDFLKVGGWQITWELNR